MPVYRCHQCGFISEETNIAVGDKIPCGRCGTASTVYGTVFYVEKLLERYVAALREIKALQQSNATEAPASAAPEAPTAPLKIADIHNTTLFATATQHAPLQTWFQSHQIEARFDYAQVDTSGFFDDAASMIGEDYALFGELVGRVCFAYRKSHSNVNLELANLSQKDAQAINQLCRQFYSQTLFARYHYQKPEKIIRLTLQTAPAVRQFFNGGWLEWYAFMALLHQLHKSKKQFSCARSVKVVFPNEDLHELDVVCLPDGQLPLIIECKSGEFRQDIDKYLRLRKRLGIPRNRFIICAADLTQEQANGLSTMYELTFVNLENLQTQLHTCLGK